MTMALQIRIVLDVGGAYDGNFALFGTSGKYAERTALQAWYDLYPASFKRDPAVDQRIYGVSASYLAWKRQEPDLDLGHGQRLGMGHQSLPPQRRHRRLQTLLRLHAHSPVPSRQ